VADKKISELPVATAMGLTEVLPIVQAGSTKQVTKTLLFTCKVGENIYIVAGAGDFAGLATNPDVGLIEVSGLGDINIRGNNSLSFLHNNSGTHLKILPTGVGEWSLPGAADRIDLGQLGVTEVIIDALAGKVNIKSPVQPFVTYIAGAGGNWNGGSPAEMALAIDRLAAAVAGLLFGPIP